MMDCLFCSDSEPEYKPGAGIDFVCSLCVQMLLEADQQDLSRAYAKAIEKGFSNKARAVELFLTEELNVRETKKLKRGVIRKKPMRVVRPSRNKLRPQPAIV